MSTREVISSGNELAAIAAVDAGCRFYGGYPITPSSEVFHVISDLLPKVGGAAVQMEDEIGGVAAAIGAGMSGVRTMTATSGPGISLKAELGTPCKYNSQNTGTTSLSQIRYLM